MLRLLKKSEKVLIRGIEEGTIRKLYFLSIGLEELAETIKECGVFGNQDFAEFDGKYQDVISYLRKNNYSEDILNYYQDEYSKLFDKINTEMETIVHKEKMESLERKKVLVTPSLEPREVRGKWVSDRHRRYKELED